MLYLHITHQYRVLYKSVTYHSQSICEQQVYYTFLGGCMQVGSPFQRYWDHVTELIECWLHWTHDKKNLGFWIRLLVLCYVFPPNNYGWCNEKDSWIVMIGSSCRKWAVFPQSDGLRCSFTLYGIWLLLTCTRIVHTAVFYPGQKFMILNVTPKCVDETVKWCVPIPWVFTAQTTELTRILGTPK